MPSPADADLARRDAALPALATLFDPEALSSVVDDAAAARCKDLELLYLRYKPGTNCIAAYRAQRDGEATLLYAKAYRSDAAHKLAKARRRSCSAGIGLPERRLVEALGLVVFGFPDDAKLPVLSRLVDADSRQRLLERVLSADAALGDTRLETLAYKPERRYVARLVAEDGEARAVLKFYGRERYPTARRAGRNLESREALRVPQRRGGSTRYHVRASEWLPGPTLREVLDSGETPELARVGAALAELHSQRGARLNRPGMEERLSELRALAQTLGFIYPPVADAALHLAEEIAKQLGSGATEATAIHGDFYDKQIVMMEERVALVDLDDAVLGDGRQDLGLFVAHLERDRLMGRPLDAIESLFGPLLEGYQQMAGRSVHDLAAFTAEGLFRLAHHPFRRHGPQWPDETRAILERSRELLAGGPLGR